MQAGVAWKQDASAVAHYPLPGKSFRAGSAQGPRDLARGARVSGSPGNFAIGRNLSARYLQYGFPDVFKIAQGYHSGINS